MIVDPKIKKKRQQTPRTAKRVVSVASSSKLGWGTARDQKSTTYPAPSPEPYLPPRNVNLDPDPMDDLVHGPLIMRVEFSLINLNVLFHRVCEEAKICLSHQATRNRVWILFELGSTFIGTLVKGVSGDEDIFFCLCLRCYRAVLGPGVYIKANGEATFWFSQLLVVADRCPLHWDPNPRINPPKFPRTQILVKDEYNIFISSIHTQKFTKFKLFK